jgi:hypothetical protein
VRGIRAVQEAAKGGFAVRAARERLITELEKVRAYERGIDECLSEPFLQRAQARPFSYQLHNVP